MGITIDHQQRFWIVIPGELKGQRTRLIAIDLDSKVSVLDYYFHEGEAKGAQDMRISKDGKTVFLADPGLLKIRESSLITLDLETKKSRTVLRGHPSVSPQNWTIRKTDGHPYRLVFNLISFAAGADGIAISNDSKWIYYAAISNDSLYRIPTSALLDTGLTKDDLTKHIELVGRKPLNDGIEVLPNNNVLITDIENGGIALLSPEGELKTITKDPKVDWADSAAVTPDGAIWFTDSQLTKFYNQFMRPPTEEELRQNGPYPIYRISPN